jgi:four helix bundle protein
MDANTKGYKELIVWQRAIELVPQVYQLTKRFPSDELYGITSQIRRAMISVPANIAEGQGRHHPKEFFNFLSIARGSLAEVDTLLIVACKLGYLHEEQLEKFESQIIRIRQLIQKLMQSLPSRFAPDALRPTPDGRHP